MDAGRALESLLEGLFENADLELFVSRLPGGSAVLSQIGEHGPHGTHYPRVVAASLFREGLVDDIFFGALDALKPEGLEDIQATRSVVYESLGGRPSPRRITDPRGGYPAPGPAVTMSATGRASHSHSRIRAVDYPVVLTSPRDEEDVVGSTGTTRASENETPTIVGYDTDSIRISESNSAANRISLAAIFYSMGGLAFLLHLTSGIQLLAENIGTGRVAGTVPGSSISWLVFAALLGLVAGTLLTFFAGTGARGRTVTEPARAVGIAGTVYLVAAMPYGLGIGSARVISWSLTGLVVVAWLLIGPLNSRATQSRTPYLFGSLVLAALLSPLILSAT